MPTKTFSAWLNAQRHRDDAVGDLACDVRSDPDWPRPKTLTQAADHLRTKNASGKALVALERAWFEFEAGNG